MSFGFEKTVMRNSNQMNNIMNDVKMTQTNRGIALIVQSIYVVLFLFGIPLIATVIFKFKVPFGISITYYGWAWCVFLLMSYHDQPSAGVAPNFLDKIISYFKSGKRFMDNQDDYIMSIKKYGYEPLVDSLMIENQEILNRKSQQDSDRFNLFFNGLLIFVLTTILTFGEKIWTLIENRISIELIMFNSPLFLSIISIIIIMYFRSGDLFHEQGEDYNAHLTLQDALFEIKNDSILDYDKGYNRSSAKKRQVR